jgi:hypothetical protein
VNSTLWTEQQTMTEMAEEQYRDWCKSAGLDPEDVGSAVAYEEMFDAEEWWREEQYQKQLREGWRSIQ